MDIKRRRGGVVLAKTCFVTGGSSGIGRGIAIAMAQAGYDIAFIHDRDDANATVVCQEIETLGRRCLVQSVDLSDATGPQRAAEFAIRELGQVDVLVNNAGISRFESTLDITEAMTDKLLFLNYRAPILLTHYLAEHMVKNGIAGRIVFTASTRGYRAYPGDAVYGGLKAALIRSTESIALDLAPYGIRVNSVAPGAIQVRWSEENDRHYQWLGARIPLGRGGVPDDVAKVVVWLASDASDYVTGTTIRVDGGLILPGMPEQPNHSPDPGWGKQLR